MKLNSLSQLKMVKNTIPCDSDVVCHLFKIRIGSEVYSVTVCGSRYKAEQYFNEELGANEIEWVKSFLMNEDMALHYSYKNKSIGREGFFMRMEFLHNYGTMRSKKLADQQEKEDNDRRS